MEEVKMEADGIDSEELVELNAPAEAFIDANIENDEDNGASVYEYPSLFTKKTLVELCNSSWSRSARARGDIQPYLRGAKWSPDGTCCLTVVNNDGVHVTELPNDLYSGLVEPYRMINVLDSTIHVKEAGLIYDFCWYPGMNSALPETCCWITTRQNGPIQLWDAYNGSLRASYKGFDNVDEMEPAISLTFSSDANKIIAGYKKCIRTFCVDRPGREFAQHNIKKPASCLATSRNLLAVGSWSTSINLFSINEMGTYKSIGNMHGHEKGVTHLKFTPDGMKLVSGARKDHRLLVWDIRFYRKPLNILSRAADTNQRIYFDVSPCGKYLVSGGTDGVVRVWDSDQVDWTSGIDVTDTRSDNATYKFQLHKDCCNSVSIHPSRPILATGSGQHHFEDPIHCIDNMNSRTNYNNSQLTSSDEQSCDELFTNGDKGLLNGHKSNGISYDMKYSSVSENCLVFWWIGDVNIQDR